ncbi:GntR family transcriptional regulator [Nocardia takedensis]|uniref:GntR family transcriptional regulator n=1 Tax=Nocardia takedensis TaxID=259390 RepID=UPI001C3F336F|nr:GntR family transcriptional regulator [Nocardia takedensis]
MPTSKESDLPQIEEVLPKYLQIAGHLRDQIVRGDLPPGAEVPSERELAAAWHVARPTAAKALATLRQQGLVETRRGSGTYVREPHAAPRARERYERAVTMGSMYSDTESVEFPVVGHAPAPDAVAAALGIEAGAQAARRCRVIRSETRGPVEMSTSWFTLDTVRAAPRLLVAERLLGGTLRYLADVLDVRATYARDQVSARLAGEEERRALGLAEPAAVLVYHLLAYDAADHVLQFDEAVYPPERWSFRQEYPVAL